MYAHSITRFDKVRSLTALDSHVTMYARSITGFYNIMIRSLTSLSCSIKVSVSQGLYYSIVPIMEDLATVDA